VSAKQSHGTELAMPDRPEPLIESQVTMDLKPVTV
jgi:hypothetical protein